MLLQLMLLLLKVYREVQVEDVHVVVDVVLQESMGKVVADVVVYDVDIVVVVDVGVLQESMEEG